MFKARFTANLSPWYNVFRFLLNNTIIIHVNHYSDDNNDKLQFLELSPDVLCSQD